MRTFSAFIVLTALISFLFFSIPKQSIASNYLKCGQQSFIADGTWQKVTCTVTPNVKWEAEDNVDSRAVSITGYAIFEATGDKEIQVCEGNTWNAAAVFLIMLPGIPRITNVWNPLVHQEGVFVKVDSATTTITAETWIKFP